MDAFHLLQTTVHEQPALRTPEKRLVVDDVLMMGALM